MLSMAWKAYSFPLTVTILRHVFLYVETYSIVKQILIVCSIIACFVTEFETEPLHGISNNLTF